jgi:hypothetical protein
MYISRSNQIDQIINALLRNGNRIDALLRNDGTRGNYSNGRVQGQAQAARVIQRVAFSQVHNNATVDRLNPATW